MPITRRGLLAMPGLAAAAHALPLGTGHAATPPQSAVTFDLFSLRIHGRRVYHWSGEFHYWRLPSPGLWRDVLQKYRAAGFTAASVYFHWGFHSSAPGVYDFTGVRDVALLLQIAAEVGIYIVARPGPYINAETDSGGFPGWVDTQAGQARTAAPDYLAAALQWYAAIDPILAAAQIDRGGPVILYQIENEYTYGPHDVAYMQALEAQARADGITVPLFHNDAYPAGNWRPGTPGGVDIYAFDSYPQGFDARHPHVWQQLPDLYYTHNEGAELNPEFVAEAQGGSFDPWGGAGFARCRALTDAAFNRQFYKNNIAGGVTMQNFYMLFGGTSWGWLPSEDLYTSYDYGAAITEARQLTAKYDEDKKLGYFVACVAPLLMTFTVSDIASTNGNLRVRSLVNPTDGTQFFTLVQTYTPSLARQQVSFPIALADGTYSSVPQQGALVIDGRDCKLLVAGYRMDRQRLRYATSEIMTHAPMGATDLAVFYGRQGEDGETVLRYTDAPAVEIIAGSVASTYDAASGDLRLNYVHDGLILLRIRSRVPLLLALCDDAAAAGFWRLDVPAGAVVVRGPPLVRTAGYAAATLALTGDTAAPTRIEVFAGFATAATAFTWNGNVLALSRTAYGAWGGTLAGPLAYTPPPITGWRTLADIPEAAPGFDDSAWTAAANTTTNNPLRPVPGQAVLYADDYGFHHGDVWYRAGFTATGSESGIELTAYTGRPGSFFVWLNGVFLGQSQVGLSNPNVTTTFAFPAGALQAGAANVVSVLVENLGHNEDFAANDSHKQPRGLTTYQLLGSGAPLAWKIQGTVGGEHPVDTVRGPYNNGGLHGERAGYHLPGYPDSGWTAVTLPTAQPSPGVIWYRTQVTLAVPAGQDVSLALQIADRHTRNYRARIFVNGWHMGIYIDDVGRQTQFVVPNGILDPNGDNTLAIAVLDGGDGSGGFGAIAFVVLGNVLGGVAVPLVDSPGYDPALYTG